MNNKVDLKDKFKFDNLYPLTEFWIQRFSMYAYIDDHKCEADEIIEHLDAIKKLYPNSKIRAVQRQLMWVETVISER